MSQLFNAILYQPTFNLLVFLYNIAGHDIGLAIILMTVIIKLVLYPLTSKSLKSQQDLQKIQPKIQGLQQKYKGQKEKLSQELMALYKREKVNPFSSCFPTLIQLPFLIAVFVVFRAGLTNPDALSALYPFITHPGALNPISFGFLDLSKTNLYLAVLAGAAQFWQTKMLVSKKPAIKSEGSKDENMAAAINKQMTYFMPIFTVFVGITLPAGLMLYWVVTTILTIAQQYILFRKKVEIKQNDNHSPSQNQN